jgi:hypothetical protein
VTEAGAEREDEGKGTYIQSGARNCSKVVDRSPTNRAIYEPLKNLAKCDISLEGTVSF